MEVLKELCQPYLSDPSYVYKNVDNYLVVLQKSKYTVTDENRTGIADSEHALYRANMLKLVHIINVAYPTDEIKSIKTDNLESTVFDKIYNVGDVLYQYYESGKYGIKYYKSIENVYYKIVLMNSLMVSENVLHEDFTLWHKNGNVAIKQTVNRENTDLMITKQFYGVDGNMLCSANFKNNKKHGRTTIYRKDRTLRCELDYNTGEIQQVAFQRKNAVTKYIITYENEKPKNITYYDDDGNVIDTPENENNKNSNFVSKIFGAVKTKITDFISYDKHVNRDKYYFNKANKIYKNVRSLYAH